MTEEQKNRLLSIKTIEEYDEIRKTGNNPFGLPSLLESLPEDVGQHILWLESQRGTPEPIVDPDEGDFFEPRTPLYR